MQEMIGTSQVPKGCTYSYLPQDEGVRVNFKDLAVRGILYMWTLKHLPTHLKLQTEKEATSEKST